MPAMRSRWIIVFAFYLVLISFFVLDLNEAYGVDYTVTFKTSGIGTDTTGTVLVVDGTSLTQAQLPYDLTITAGQSITYTFSNPVTATSTKRYTWSKISGTFSSLTASTATFTPSSSGTVIGDYVVEYKVTYTQSGLSGTGGNSVVTVDGSAKILAELPFSKWYASGSTSQYSFVSPVSSGTTTRYVWSSTSGSGQSLQSNTWTVSQDGTVTASYVAQYYLTLNAPSYASLSGQGWYSVGTIASFSTDSPVSGGTGRRYVFTTWTGDFTGTSPSGSLTMGAAKTVTANYKTQYYLTVSGGSSTSGEGWYDEGSTATSTSSNTWGIAAGQSRQSLVSWQLDTTVTPVTRASSGTFTTPAITMNIYHTLTFNPVAQYYLSVNGGNGIIYSPTSPTSDNWYDSGTTVTVTTDRVWGTTGQSRYSLVSWTGQSRYSLVSWTGQSRYSLVSWQLDGVTNALIRASSGTFTTTAISMNTYHSLTFNAFIQHYLTITAPPYAAATGEGWYDEGTRASFSVTSPVPEGTGKRYVFVAWTGAYAGGSTTADTTMNEPKKITAIYKTQYYLMVIGGSSTLGEGWYDEGSTATSTSQYVWGLVAGQTRYNLKSFSVDGVPSPVSRRGFGVFTTPGISISAPRTVVFTEVIQHYLAVSGGVNVAFSAPSLTGDQWYDDEVSVMVSSDILGPLRVDVRLRVTSWTLDGKLAPITQISGVFTTPLINMKTFHSLKFLEVFQYRLMLEGGNNMARSLTSVTQDDWYDEGSILTVSADHTWSINPEQSRINLLSFILDEESISIDRKGKGTFTSRPINMSSPHRIRFVPVTQYYLSTAGGYNVTVLRRSATLDNWYDLGTPVEVSANHAWNQTATSRLNLISWAMDNEAYPLRIRENSGKFTTPTILMNEYHKVMFNPVVQYYLQVEGGSQITYSVASPTRDNWYDKNTELTVSTAYVWNSTDSRRLNLLAWRMDEGSSLNVARQGRGVFITPNFAMISARRIVFTDLTQYFLLLQSNITSAPHIVKGSQTSDRWFDSGTVAFFGSESLTVPITKESRYAFVSWAGAGEASYTGPDVTREIVMNSTVVEMSLWKTQHLVTFLFTDFYAGKELLPSSIGIIDSSGKTHVLTNHSYFADQSSSWKIGSVVWQSLDVGPKEVDTVSYSVGRPISPTTKLHAYTVDVVVKDPLGLLIPGAMVNVTLSNSTVVTITTPSSGIASLGYVPFGTFKGHVNFLGDLVPISAESTGKQVIQTQITLSYPILTFIVAGEIAGGIVFYILSPLILEFLSSLQGRINKLAAVFRR